MPKGKESQHESQTFSVEATVFNRLANPLHDYGPPFQSFVYFQMTWLFSVEKRIKSIENGQESHEWVRLTV